MPRLPLALFDLRPRSTLHEIRWLGPAVGDEARVECVGAHELSVGKRVWRHPIEAPRPDRVPQIELISEIP